MQDDQQLDFSAIREKLRASKGRQYWKSLDQLGDTPAFRDFMQREFPRQAQFLDAMGRRRFLKLMGASLALAGAGTGCGIGSPQPQEKIVAYVDEPDNIVYGQPLYFTTAMAMNGAAIGLLAESHEGRPTKLEGNPDHPGSLGRTDRFAQASVLQLYDPDRSQVVVDRTLEIPAEGRLATYGEFIESARRAAVFERSRRGAGLRILTEPVISPTLSSQLEGIRRLFPDARIHQYEPVSRDNERAGARLAFGDFVDTIYNFEEQDVTLSLDSDFLSGTGKELRYQHDWSNRRRIGGPDSRPCRLYAVESTATNTGSMADHKLPMQASRIEAFARTVAARLGVAGIQPAESGAPENFIATLVEDLRAARGRSIVIAGENQPPAVHALAHAMNEALGSVGRAVTHIAPIAFDPSGEQVAGLRELVNDMNAGRVTTLLIVGGNPVYDAPADIPFGAALEKMRREQRDERNPQQRFSVHLSLYDDETSELTLWHIPQAHFLEAWSDTRALDGTATVVQPLIEPLYEGARSAHEFLSVLSDNPSASGHDLVRTYWQGRTPRDFERVWRRALHEGIWPDTASQPARPRLAAGLAGRLGPARPAPEGLEVVFRPDPSIWDGRFANNGWLQELPKPLTKLVWDNAALIGFSTAQELNLRNEDVVELTYKGRTLNAPVWVMPGHAPDSVTLYLGYGRTRAGQVAEGNGFNAYALRTSEAPYFDGGLQLRRTDEEYTLVSTQDHHFLEGRDHVRTATLAEYRQNPEFAQAAHGDEGLSLYPEYTYDGNAWGMAIDMNACTGCNACVIACQAENNIPVVGKDQVANGREMHWLRIDQYYTTNEDNLDNPRTINQPMMCQHCEKAPCEPVCPVYATAHDQDGLNVMIYNRCIGTRYCSNNCPYKVRRFNWLQYNDKQTPQLKMQRNPQVTVRERGVMEKCTYCLQRIRWASIDYSKKNQDIPDGALKTACQQVCPTDAIVFGDLNNRDSAVNRLKAQERNYSVLGELNTTPRTTYLAAILNPHEGLSVEEDEAE